MKSKIIFTVLFLACLLFVFGCAKEKEVVNKEPEVRVVIEAESYSLDDVALHGSENDCWIAIKGKVYDVTSYISEHNSKILTGCGKEATEFFDAIPKHDDKKSLLNSHYIGDLKV